jgi:hypothetical protein
MPKYLFIMALPFIAAWLASRWWQMKTARSERERSLISRSTLGASVGTVIAVLSVFVLPPQGKIVALPLSIAAAVIYSRGMKAAREKIRAEESNPDPVSRAKRVS